MNQVDWEKMQENMNLSLASYTGNSPWSTAQNAYNINNGSLVSGTYSGTQQFGDGSFETFREENPQTNTSLNPSNYVLGGSTTYGSGSISDLATNNGASMAFGSSVSSSSGQTLYAHKETTNIAGTTYNTSKLTNADTTGSTLSTSLAGSRSLLDKSVYSLQGVTSVPASTWTMYYRAWKDTASGVPTNSPSSTVGGWTNPTNAYADGGSYASCNINGTRQVYSGYGFSVPGSAQITQVRVKLDAYVSGGDSNDKILLEVPEGESWSTTSYQQSLSASETPYWIDVTSWTTWDPTTVNSIQIRVTQIRSGSSTDEVRLDWIPIEVTYTTPSTTTNPPSSTSPTSGNWTNPTYAYASDSSYAYSSTNGRQQTYAGYGYNIPSNAVVTRIRVRVDAWVTGTYEQNDAIKVEVSADGGAHWLTTTQTIYPTTSEVTYWVDVTSWASWAPANVNSDNIKVRVTQVRVGSYTDQVRLDYVPVEVTYTTPTVVTQSPSGSNPDSWTNPTNAYADGGSYASSGYYGDDQQVYGGYGFAVPSGAQITQARVRLDAWCSGDDVILLQVSGDGGSTWLTNTQTIVPTTSEATYWVDVTSWTSWTPANINNDNIKLRVTHVRVGGLGYVYVDWIPVEVSYTIPSTAHVDVDILIRTSTGTIRATIATNVASSADLSNSAQTLSATYSWSGYTVVDQSDYLEIDYYVDPTVTGNVNAYLIIDNSSLAPADQTRASNVMLPSQYTVQVELTGSGTILSGETLLWTVDGGFSVASVSTTLQVYNYNSGQYPSSGDGYIAYTSNATPGAHDTKTQLITVNPTYYSGSGVWKVRVTGVSNSAFSLNLDWIEYKKIVPNLYNLDISNSYILNLDTYPTKHISNLTLQATYNVSDVGASTRWLVKAYNWTTSSFSNTGFNDTAGSLPTVIGQWNNYTLSIPKDYVAANGTVLIKFLNGFTDGNQTTVGVDFLGVRAVMDGGQDWLLENSSPETIHVVAVWITNSTLHQRYNKDVFINSGETNDALFTGLNMPSGSFVAKVVTERGNVIILPSG